MWYLPKTKTTQEQAREHHRVFGNLYCLTVKSIHIALKVALLWKMLSERYITFPVIFPLFLLLPGQELKEASLHSQLFQTATWDFRLILPTVIDIKITLDFYMSQRWISLNDFRKFVPVFCFCDLRRKPAQSILLTFSLLASYNLQFFLSSCLQKYGKLFEDSKCFQTSLRQRSKQ